MKSGLFWHSALSPSQTTLAQAAQSGDFSRLTCPILNPFQGTFPVPGAWPDNPISPPTMPRRHHAIPLQQAAQEAPALSVLMGRVRDSCARLQAIHGLLPVPLRSSVQAGPFEDGTWCLLCSSNAVAAKLRQLLPAFQAHLQSQQLGVVSIRIKVQNK
jgi:hypothetical protein